MSMTKVTLTSGCNNTISQALSIDASFSSYLNNSSEEAFVCKLAESNQNLYLGKKKVVDGEIGVFGAEKYFNGGIDDDNLSIPSNSTTINYQHVKVEQVDLVAAKPRIQVGTSSIHSESSWNSQSALLQQSVVRNPPQRKTYYKQGKSLLASIGCGCSCNDKNSVDINEHVGGVVHAKTVTKEPVQNGLESIDLVRTNKSRLNPLVMEEVHCKKIDGVGPGLSRDDCFSFPILNSKPATNLAVKVHSQEEEEEEEDEKQRKSLEVFGSPVLQKKKKSLGLERRRVTMLTWDTSPRMEEVEIPRKSDGTYINDSESDASSDLFEIESFTNNSNPFLRRQASDGMSSCVTQTTTCYAPSEASIEWSVVTASAADFSVVSDSEDNSISSEKAPKMAPNAKFGMGKEMDRRRSGILLGCKSHKAVNVAGDAHRTSGKAVPEPLRHYRPENFSPVTRFKTKAQLTDFDSMNRQHGFVHSMI